METAVRLMTDMEEEILFRLTTSDYPQGSLALSEKISVSLNRNIPLGEFHQTLIALEDEGFIQSVKTGSRKSYRITEPGKTALQQEWDYYKSRYTA